jgi:hypothetical protein
MLLGALVRGGVGASIQHPRQDDDTCDVSLLLQLMAERTSLMIMGSVGLAATMAIFVFTRRYDRPIATPSHCESRRIGSAPSSAFALLLASATSSAARGGGGGREPSRNGDAGRALVTRSGSLNTKPPRPEEAMRTRVLSTALGLTFVAGVPAANAQTVMTRQIADQPVETAVAPRPTATVIAQTPLATAPPAAVQPMRTIRPVQTVRTVRPVPRHIATHRTITARPTIVHRVVAVPSAVAAAPAGAADYPAPLYDEGVPGPVMTAPAYSQQPLFNEVAPASAVDTGLAPPPLVAAPGALALPLYDYVYQPDRILVIDPATGIAVQAIPR